MAEWKRFFEGGFEQHPIDGHHLFVMVRFGPHPSLCSSLFTWLRMRALMILSHHAVREWRVMAAWARSPCCFSQQGLNEQKQAKITWLERIVERLPAHLLQPAQ